MYGRVFVRQGARRPTLLSLTSAYRPWLASTKGMFTNAALGLFGLLLLSEAWIL